MLRSRPAVASDSEVTWRINNHPSVRANAVHREDIPFGVHAEWFARKLGDPLVDFIIIEEGTTPVAVARAEVTPDGSGAVISLAVDPGARGRGVGQFAIREVRRSALARRPLRGLTAWILPSNAASVSAFHRCGFHSAGVHDGLLQMECPRGRGSVAFRADASLAVGAGHVLRCFGLAAALRELGWNCAIYGECTVPFVQELLISAGLAPRPPEELANARPDVLVVDHYGERPPLPGVKSAVTVVFDDAGGGSHAADVVVNGHDAPADRYRVLPGGAVLVGPRFLSIRPDVVAAGRSALGPRRRAHAPVVLCVAGGTDVKAVGPALAQAARKAHAISEVRLVTSSATAPAGVTPVAPTPHLAREIMNADLVVAAAGTVTWEVLMLGVPLASLRIAQNQVAVEEMLRTRDLAAILPADEPSRWPDVIGRALEEESALERVARAGSLIDGEGSRRIADEIHARTVRKRREAPES